MYDHEKETGRLSQAGKKEVAEAAAIMVEDVEDVLVKHKQMK